ncbi:hypothetical protein PPACK8108_LOCUS4421 [Phakopsora pachyrhizi]|uniref:DH domain-containing protein n=1 Tax=Phakopsora pachyrhizi TaxID=170000 RepID=A0AAV0ANU9_PHAPC|nr:hypothetical protein PPACK8108_LOCUS4421 [Phakopsora pachyrhizi]
MDRHALNSSLAQPSRPQGLPLSPLVSPPNVDHAPVPTKLAVSQKPQLPIAPQPNQLTHQFLLTELVESEKAYANDLFIIIKRIAAAYSPQNFPPPHLDHHFRLIESIFRTHKNFVATLLKLEPPPEAFPFGSFVQLLISWINDLGPVYHRYCSPNGWAGAGRWSQDQGVMSNKTLVSTLLSLQWPSSLPPPPNDIFPGAPYHPEDQYIIDSHRQPHALLTVHFALPFSRLVYYRRFYEKVLHQTVPGRPEHRMIFEATNKLSELLDLGCNQWSVDPIGRTLGVEFNKGAGSNVAQPEFNSNPSHNPKQQILPAQDHPRGNSVPVNNNLKSNPSSRSNSIIPQHPSPSTRHPPQLSNQPLSGVIPIRRVELTDVSLADDRQLPAAQSVGLNAEIGAASSSISSMNDEVFDRTNPSTPLSAASGASEKQLSTSSSMIEISPGILVQQAVLDFNIQLDTSRCKDIFTMLPKLCRLHLAPSTLTHSRTLRTSIDASFKIRPTSDPNLELFTPLGRLILLTDLLMFCEYIPPDQIGPSSHLLWLMYPPLAAKHLRVASSPTDERELEVLIMGKEVVKVMVKSRTERDNCVQSLVDAIEFGMNPSSSKVLIPNSGNSLTAANHSTENPASNLFSVSGNVPAAKSPDNDKIVIASSNQTLSPTFSPREGASKSSLSPSSPNVESNLHTPQLAEQDSNLTTMSPQHSELPKTEAQEAIPEISAIKQTAGALGDHLASHPAAVDQQRPGSVDDAHFPSRIPLPIRIGTASGPSAPRPIQPRSSVSSGDAHGTALRSKTPGLPVAGKVTPTLRKAPSAHNLGFYDNSKDLRYNYPPPLPPSRSGAAGTNLQFLQDKREPGVLNSRSSDGMLTPMGSAAIPRLASVETHVKDLQYRPPSSVLITNKQRLTQRDRSGQAVDYNSGGFGDDEDDVESLQGSPKEEAITESVLAATMKTKVFLKQAHSQWKSLGAAKLHVFIQNPGNLKQLVVGDNKGKTIISTIVITDGVERVGRTGVAVDLSDKGARTGIVYMLQMKNETSADGLFEQLLAGSDRRPK